MNSRALQLLLCKETGLQSNYCVTQWMYSTQRQNVLYKDCGISEGGKSPVRRKHPPEWVKSIFNVSQCRVVRWCIFSVLDFSAKQQLYKTQNNNLCETTSPQLSLCQTWNVNFIDAEVKASVIAHWSFKRKRRFQFVVMLDTGTYKSLWSHVLQR